jgi:hypothetical protein
MYSGIGREVDEGGGRIFSSHIYIDKTMIKSKMPSFLITENKMDKIGWSFAFQGGHFLCVLHLSLSN